MDNTKKLPHGYVTTSCVKWGKPRKQKVNTEYRRSVKSLKRKAYGLKQSLKSFMLEQSQQSNDVATQWLNNKGML